MNMEIQNTCPATWVNSSIIPNQSTFQAYPISAPVESIARIRDILERSGPTPKAFSLGAAVVRGAVPGILALAGIRILSWVALLVIRNTAVVAWGGAAGIPPVALPGPPRVSG